MKQKIIFFSKIKWKNKKSLLTLNKLIVSKNNNKKKILHKLMKKIISVSSSFIKNLEIKKNDFFFIGHVSRL